MSMPLRKPQPEKPMDERTPRLEAHFEHLQSDVTEVKAGMRYVEAKVDRLNEKLDSRTEL